MLVYLRDGERERERERERENLCVCDDNDLIGRLPLVLPSYQEARSDLPHTVPHTRSHALQTTTHVDRQTDIIAS